MDRRFHTPCYDEAVIGSFYETDIKAPHSQQTNKLHVNVHNKILEFQAVV